MLVLCTSLICKDLQCKNHANPTQAKWPGISFKSCSAHSIQVNCRTRIQRTCRRSAVRPGTGLNPSPNHPRFSCSVSARSPCSATIPRAGESKRMMARVALAPGKDHNQLKMGAYPQRPRRSVTMAGPSASKRNSLRPQATLTTMVLLVGFLAGMTTDTEPTVPPLDRPFATVVQPFLKTYCLACHGAEKPKAKLDLSAYQSPAAVANNHLLWDRVVERLEAGE